MKNPCKECEVQCTRQESIMCTVYAQYLKERVIFLDKELAAMTKRAEYAERELEMLHTQREILTDELTASQNGKHKAQADKARLLEELKAIRPFVVYGVDWTDETAKSVREIFNAALQPERGGE